RAHLRRTHRRVAARAGAAGAAGAAVRWRRRQGAARRFDGGRAAHALLLLRGAAVHRRLRAHPAGGPRAGAAPGRAVAQPGGDRLHLHPPRSQAGGAALAVLFAGPAINLPSLFTVAHAASWRLAVFVALMVWSVAVAGGLVLGLLT